MNNSFQFVQNCLLNTSKAKQAHQFPKASRFPKDRIPPCSQSSYDLSKTMFGSTISHKPSIQPRQFRFKSSATISPPPNAYYHHSFIDINRSTSRGNTFSHEGKLLDRSRRSELPGPANYDQTYNPEKKLSYTMRSKVNQKDHRPKVDPGQYAIENYHGFSKPQQISSKYNNPKNTVFGSRKRFNPKEHETVGPGPTVHGRVKTENGDTPKYSFGCLKKEPSYIRKNGTPGPDSYNRFSEFSELKNGLRSMQSSKSIRYQ